MDEAAYVLPAFGEVQQHIADTLTGAVVGVAPAAAGLHHLEPRVEQFFGGGARPRGVDRRVIEQPQQLARGSLGNGPVARLHFGQSLAIGHGRALAHDFDFRRQGCGHRRCVACPAAVIKSQ
jgi:hypothetical protein